MVCAYCAVKNVHFINNIEGEWQLLKCRYVFEIQMRVVKYSWLNWGNLDLLHLIIYMQFRNQEVIEKCKRVREMTYLFCKDYPYSAQYYGLQC